MAKQYRLLRLYNGKYIPWGVFTDPKMLANAAFELGRFGYEGIMVEEYKPDDKEEKPAQP